MAVYYTLVEDGKSASVTFTPEFAKELTFERIERIEIRLKGNRSNTRIQVMLRDASGEVFVHKNNIYLNGDAWTTATALFPEDVKHLHHRSGNKDGIMDPPMRMEQIIVRGIEYKEGNPIYIHSMKIIGKPSGEKKVETGTAVKEAPDFSLQEVGSLAPVRPGDDAKVKLRVRNSSETGGEYKITAGRMILLAEGKDKAVLTASVKPGGTREIKLPFEFKTPDVHELELSVDGNGKEWRGATVVNVWEPVGNAWNDAPETFFGAMQSLDLFMRTLEQDLALMQASGVKIVRFLIRWREVEKIKGEYDWRPYDRIVDACRKYGIIPYPIIDRPPLWAADPELVKSAPKYVMGFVPADFDYYAGFVGKVVERYRDWTKYFQV